MWCTGLVALRHVGSSQTRARTCVPCIGRRILNHRATREAPDAIFISFVFLCFVYRFSVLLGRERNKIMDSAHCLEPHVSNYLLLIPGIQPSVSGIEQRHI